MPERLHIDRREAKRDSKGMAIPQEAESGVAQQRPKSEGQDGQSQLPLAAGGTLFSYSIYNGSSQFCAMI